MTAGASGKMASEMERAAERVYVAAAGSSGPGDGDRGLVATRATDLASDFHLSSATDTRAGVGTAKSARRDSLPTMISKEPPWTGALYVAFMPLPGISRRSSTCPLVAAARSFDAQYLTIALAMGWLLFSSTLLRAAS